MGSKTESKEEINTYDYLRKKLIIISQFLP